MVISAQNVSKRGKNGSKWALFSQKRAILGIFTRSQISEKVKSFRILDLIGKSSLNCIGGPFLGPNWMSAQPRRVRPAGSLPSRRGVQKEGQNLSEIDS